MTKLICLLACALAWTWPAAGRAQDETDAVPPDICSARFSSAPPEQRAAAMRPAVKEAIATLGNAQIRPASPSLASGTVSYISVSPNFAQQLENVCILGYFALKHNGTRSALPMLVDHIELVKTPNPADPNQPIASSRIYFRTPRIEEFANGRELENTWRFWERHQLLEVRMAAFAYRDGQRGAPYFGYSEEINVTSKGASTTAALLFAGFFYVLAAGTVPSVGGQGRGWLAGLRHNLVRRLMPWHIAGTDGTASLSQLQMLAFTLIVATLLFYQWLRTGLLQEISTDLLYLIGISTAGAAGTQVTTSIKKDLEPDCYAYVQQLGWFNAPQTGATRQATAGELLMTNKRFDIYKFQMLVFTFVIAAYVIASGADQLGNIQISATLLTLMGMSQGAYVGGKVAGDKLTPLQNQLRGLQNLQQRYLASNSPRVREELQRRFVLSATQTAALFSTVFGRTVPDYLLEIPLDAEPAPSP